MLGAFFLILLFGLGLLFRLSWGDGELGSTKNDQLGTYETFTAAAPLIVRAMTATSDPAMDTAQPWNHFTSIAVDVTMPQGLFSIAAKRLDGDHLVDLQGLGGDRFRDEFPSECRTVKCTRSYVLVACSTEPGSGGSSSDFMGASIFATPAGTSSASVTLSPSPDLLTDVMVNDLVKATGC